MTQATLAEPKLRICERCGAEFELDPRPQTLNRRTCGATCRMAMWREANKLSFTGKCLVCEAPTKYPHKTCSREHRDIAATTGHATATIICVYCGESKELPANDARRQDFCSKSCRGRGGPNPVVLPPIDVRFGSWLSGLTDGEGCFFLGMSHRDKGGDTAGSIVAFFTIGLRRDDRPALEMIQSTLGFGRISNPNATGKNKDGTPINPKSVLYFSNTTENLAIVRLFREFPLRAKKARDFVIWAETIELMVAGETNRDVYREQVRRIRSIRMFVNPDSPKV